MIINILVVLIAFIGVALTGYGLYLSKVTEALDPLLFLIGGPALFTLASLVAMVRMFL